MTLMHDGRTSFWPGGYSRSEFQRDQATHPFVRQQVVPLAGGAALQNLQADVHTERVSKDGFETFFEGNQALVAAAQTIAGRRRFIETEVPPANNIG